jgi:cytosine/uracil/thiamine/allantoin permease
MLAWALHVIITRMDGRLDLSAVPTTTTTTIRPIARWGSAITSVAGSWATLALNIPDFARFAKDERSQILGQALGLPLSL